MQGDTIYTGIFDSHAHYNDERFDEDRGEVFDTLPKEGVCNVVNIGTDLPTSRDSVALAEKYDFVYAAVGFHPEEAAGCTDEAMEEIISMLKHEKVVAIGEIGLDYYWPEPDRETQKKVFARQLALAEELDMPVIIHSRDAVEDTIQMLKQFPKVRGVIHCFTGSAETAKIYLKMGFYIGFTGVLTFKNSRKPVEACKIVPMDRLLLETDCPYMAPVPYRGHRCWSAMIARTAERAAEIKEMPVQELIDRARENTKRLFRIP